MRGAVDRAKAKTYVPHVLHFALLRKFLKVTERTPMQVRAQEEQRNGLSEGGGWGGEGGRERKQVVQLC